MTNSKQLRNRLTLMGGVFEAALARFWARPEPAATYRAFLLHAHQVMRATVPLLDAAERCATERAADDPVCARLAHYYAVHREEERDHARWALEDLAVAGLPSSQSLAQIPSAPMAAAVGAQYYWVQHHHPVALLGYLTLLEDRPAPESYYDELQLRSGLPRTAFRVLRVHARLDPGHRADQDHFLDSLPLSSAHWAAIGVSMAHSAGAFARALDELGPTGLV